MKKIAALAISALVLFPSVGSTQTIGQLQAQLAQLMQLLAALQGGQQTQAPNNPTCVYLTRDLGPDDEDVTKGGEVSKLQRFLANNPAWYPEGRVTGFYGPLTVRAVQRYQASRGLISYGTPETTGFGRVGARTRELMAANCTGVAPTPFPPTLPPTPLPPPPPPPPNPYAPFTSSVTYDFRLNQYFEARANGFYVQIISIGSNVVGIEVGMPRCGTPRWPSGTGDAPVCGAIGTTQRLSVPIGGQTQVQLDTQSIILNALSIVNGIARVSITPLTNTYTPTNPITCSMSASATSIVLNQSVSLTWSSTNATSARWIQGPFVNTTNVGLQGTASTNSLTETRPFTIEFSNANEQKTCSVIVNVAGSPSLTVSLPPAGQTVNRGDYLAIAWNSSSVPLNSYVRLEIYGASQSVVSGNNDRGILSVGAASGAHQWRVPSSTAPLVADTGIISGLADGLYRIVAKLYTGDTCWGLCPNATRTIHSTGESGTFTIGTPAPTYSQGSYYSESGYYAQSNYYNQGNYYEQSSYYSQSNYSP